MIARHPNRHQLAKWLEGEAPSFDSHLDGCAVCAETLDSMTVDDVDLGPALLVLLEPPPDLEARVSRRIAERLQSRRDAELFGSLMGISVEATKIILEPPDRPPGREEP